MSARNNSFPEHLALSCSFFTQVPAAVVRPWIARNDQAFVKFREVPFGHSAVSRTG